MVSEVVASERCGAPEDEQRVGGLAAGLAMYETSISPALRLLRTSGVVRNHRDGRHVLYRLGDAHVRALLDLSREHLRHAGTEGTDG